MEKDIEIGIIKAGCTGQGGEELYWLFSRKQLEFVGKELELVDSTSGKTAAYMNMELPVVSLEQYFGYANSFAGQVDRYMVLRAADEKGEVHRLVVEAKASPRFFKLTNSFVPQEDFTVPANANDYHGAYLIGSGKVVIVPDVVTISIAFKRDNI